MIIILWCFLEVMVLYWIRYSWLQLEKKWSYFKFCITKIGILSFSIRSMCNKVKCGSTDLAKTWSLIRATKTSNLQLDFYKYEYSPRNQYVHGSLYCQVLSWLHHIKLPLWVCPRALIQTKHQERRDPEMLEVTLNF